MVYAYVDASFVVSLLVNEKHSDAADAWLRQHSDAYLLSAAWCSTEVASALALKVRTFQIMQTDADVAWQQYEQFCGSMLHLDAVCSDDITTAAQLCRVSHSALKAGDALHLAVARRLRCVQMLSFDKNLNLNAQAAGLAIML